MSSSPYDCSQSRRKPCRCQTCEQLSELHACNARQQQIIGTLNNKITLLENDNAKLRDYNAKLNPDHSTAGCPVCYDELHNSNKAQQLCNPVDTYCHRHRAEYYKKQYYKKQYVASNEEVSKLCTKLTAAHNRINLLKNKEARAFSVLSELGKLLKEYS